MFRYIFLDVDGVLNSWRTCYAFGDIPHPSDPIQYIHDRLDPVARGLINQLVFEGCTVILSSSWRATVYSDELRLDQMSEALGITLKGMTPAWVPDGDGSRGEEIDHWLRENAPKDEYFTYCIIDDKNMFKMGEQQQHLVLVDQQEGFGFKDYERARLILGLNKPMPVCL